MGSLRAVPPDDSPALTKPELAKRGANLLHDARSAAADAMEASGQGVFFFADHRYSIHKVKVIRELARDAVAAWSKLDAVLCEIIKETEKTNSLGEG